MEITTTLTNNKLGPIYNSAPKTQCFIISNKDNFIPFIREFKYFGSYIDFLLNDTLDIKIRVKQVTKAIGILSII